MLTNLTDNEAIAKVMLVRDKIRNNDVADLADLDLRMRLEYTDALAQVLNLAELAIKN